MANAVHFQPQQFHSVTPYLTVSGVAKLIDFLQRAFGATEIERMPRADGTIQHAEVKIGDSIVMMGEPADIGKARPSTLYLYLPDVDAAYKAALAAGAKSLMEPADQFYGDRSGGVEDASGNYWYIATHVADVSPEEMQERAKAAQQAQATGSKSS